MRSPGGQAAPPLTEVTKRMYVGGVLPTSPSNLVRWIVNPKEFSPRTAMPVTGITAREANDVVAYLYTLQ
jgi:cytochrome c1